MCTKQFLDNLTNGDPDYMRKLNISNEVTLTECFNGLKRNKVVINFHLSTYMFQQSDFYNPVELAAALIDMEANLQMMLNKLKELK